MKGIRILLIVGSFPPMKCGVGDYTERLAQALASRIRSVSAVGVLTDSRARPAAGQAPVEILPIARSWRPSDGPRVLAGLHGWKPDIVHFQYPSQGYGRRWLPWLLPSLVFILRIPIVQTWHEYYRDWRNRGLWRNLPNALLPGGLVGVRPNYLETMPGFYRWLTGRKIFRFIPNASAIPVAMLNQNEREQIAARYGRPRAPIVAYFGFAYPAKGVETLFAVADPNLHHLVLVCDLDPNDAYQAMILRRVHSRPWQGKATVTGFLPEAEAARVLAAADAVVLPFRNGGGMWNSSLHAAAQQGTFVLATSTEQAGYDPAANVHYARPGDLEGLRTGLREHIGARREPKSDGEPHVWEQLAEDHIALYEQVLGRGG